ncbi:MAG: hypothetical protein EZS28_034513, partial [Streblomastix strix]
MITRALSPPQRTTPIGLASPQRASSASIRKEIIRTAGEEPEQLFPGSNRNSIQMAERKWALDLVNFDDVEQHVSLQKQKLDQRDKVVDALPSVAPSFLSVTFTTTAAICQAVEDQKGDQEQQTKEIVGSAGRASGDRIREKQTRNNQNPTFYDEQEYEQDREKHMEIMMSNPRSRNILRQNENEIMSEYVQLGKQIDQLENEDYNDQQQDDDDDDNNNELDTDEFEQSGNGSGNEQ